MHTEFWQKCRWYRMAFWSQMALLFHNSNNNQQPGSDFVFKKINIFICSKSGGHWAFHNVQCLVVIFLNKNVSFSVSSMLERSYAKSETIEAIHRRITICQSKHKCFGPRSLLSACLSYYFLLKKKNSKSSSSFGMGGSGLVVSYARFTPAA